MPINFTWCWSAAMDYYDMEDELSAVDLKEFIKRMVGELPPRQQEVFKMSRDEHLTHKRNCYSVEYQWRKQ